MVADRYSRCFGPVYGAWVLVGGSSRDTVLMELAEIREWEQCAVLDIDDGARFETCAIPVEPGQVCLNGAAARLVQPGDRVIIITYADYEDSELDGFQPTVVHVDASNGAEFDLVDH